MELVLNVHVSQTRVAFLAKIYISSPEAQPNGGAGGRGLSLVGVVVCVPKQYAFRSERKLKVYGTERQNKSLGSDPNNFPSHHLQVRLLGRRGKPSQIHMPARYK